MMRSRTAWGLMLYASTCSMGGDWPELLGPNKNGTAPDESIISSIPKDGLPIRWRVKAGTGFSGPSVADGRVILFHQPDDEEVVACHDTKSGKELWKTGYPTNYRGGYGTEPGPRSTPAIAEDRVFTFGATGMLQGLDLATGRVVWRRDLKKEFGVDEGFFGVGTSPTVEGNRLLVTVGAPRASLMAFDVETGKTLWSTQDETASYASPMVADLDGTRRGLFFARTGLHVVDIDQGKELAFFRWRARMNASVNAATPVVWNDQIFLSAEYGTGAVLLHWQKGELETVWQSQDALSNHYNTSFHRDGYLFGIDGRQEFGPNLRCIDAETGKVMWTEEGFGCAHFIIIGQQVLSVTESGELVLWQADPGRYQELGRQRIGDSPTRALPALSNGLLYVRTPTDWIAIDVGKS